MLLEDLFQRLENKMDSVTDQLVTIRVDLEEHMRRTEAAEATLKVLQEETKPLKTHVAIMAALGKVLALTGTGVGIAVGLSKLLGWG